MDPTGAAGPALGNMAVWIPVAAAVAAVALGIIVGIVVGKYQVRRARSGRLKVLTKKEKIIYGSCVLLGVICIALGAFVKLPESGAEAPPEGMNVTDGPVPEGEAPPDAAVDAGDVSVDTPVAMGRVVVVG
jgi:formate hydrogenlyase subunit 3/multisubunit Na+/H+ antiporter MnhD subunit